MLLHCNNKEIQTAEILLGKKFLSIFVHPVYPLFFALSFLNFAQIIFTDMSTYSANFKYVACKLLKLENR